MRPTRRGALAALVSALACSSAAAADLTGSWEMKISCRGLAAGVPFKAKETLSLPIHQTLDGILDGGSSDTGALHGFVLYDAAKPEQGRLTLMSCNLSGALAGFLIHASGKVLQDGGRLKGTLVSIDALGETARVCKVRIERSEQGAPMLICP